MASSEQMRAAWSRRTDDELFHALFIEELSIEGRRVVTELVAEKVGDIDAYVRQFEVEQGEVIARLAVAGFDACHELKQMNLPRMSGVLVLTARGIGFIPACRDEDFGGELLERGLGAASGDLAGSVGKLLWSGFSDAAHHVDDLTSTALPLPLLAQIDSTAVWLPMAATMRCRGGRTSARSCEPASGCSRSSRWRTPSRRSSIGPSNIGSR